MTGLLSDVARPDRISGADINAICQEVKFPPIQEFEEMGSGQLLWQCWGGEGGDTAILRMVVGKKYM